MNKMEEFLEEIAKSHGTEDDRVTYTESVSADAINGDAWLENGTTYIWKVGILTKIDSNKCDWVNVFIAHQRDENATPQFIGHLHWQEGENDDIGRSLDRYLAILRRCPNHPVFEGRH